MVSKLYSFIFLLFLLAAKTSIAQPGGGGGIYIMKIYGADKKLIAKNDTSLKIHYFILPKKKAKPKEYFKKDWLYYYSKVDTGIGHIYIPAIIKKRKEAVYVPNQRLQLIF